MPLFGPNIAKMERNRDVGGLIGVLRHKDRRLRAQAACALGRVGDAMALESLTQAMNDESELVRYEVAVALGRIGDPRAIEPLIQVLHHEYRENIRNATANALAHMGKPAVEPLIQVMTWSKNGHSHPAQDMAANALVSIGKPAVEPLVQHLKVPSPTYSRPVSVIEVLGRIRDARAVGSLIPALLSDRNGEAREEAAKALGKIGDLHTAETTIDWLFSKEAVPGYLYWRPTGVPLTVTKPDELNSWIKSMKKLFGDYTGLLLRSSVYIKGFPDKLGSRESTEAIHELCQIHTQISNNILHKVSKKVNVEADVQYGIDGMTDQPTYRHETWDFSHQCKMAEEELERRGNPPYDPSAYLNKEAWKLSSERLSSRTNLPPRAD